MVAYNITGKSREPTLFVLAIISAFITGLVTRIFNILDLALVAPSGLMIFGLLVFIFDRFIWKLPIMRDVIGIPDLN